MLETVLFFVHYALLLVFGILLSAAFTGVRLSVPRNAIALGALFALCGILQLITYLLFDEALVWKIYPLITHLPIGLVLCISYRKRLVTVLAAISSAYLCCQPAKWLGMLCSAMTHSQIAAQVVQILSLLITGSVVLYFLAPYLSQIFQKDTRSVCIFSSVPIVYYLFDYTMGIYTDLWTTNNRIVAEFLPFFLCIVFMLFCFVYYKEYEQKADAERKEHLVQITAEQQSREIEAFRRSEQEIRLMRHDMRLLLNSLAVCIENGELSKAQELIASYVSHIEGTRLEHFCENATVNYILSDYAAKCKANRINFLCTVVLEELKVDEILFCSILSNALDNAFNAQADLPAPQRSIRLMLKNADGKLLLSVKNPTARIPTFVDGLPTTDRDGHGYGTQSIRYLTERLGGNCQFTVQDHIFITRVIL